MSYATKSDALIGGALLEHIDRPALPHGERKTVLPATASGPTPYRRRLPECTLFYRIVQAHFETWLALTRDGSVDVDPVPAPHRTSF